MTDHRLQTLSHWLSTVTGHQNLSIEVASEDASFRRYFRTQIDNISYIVMDAPPAQEDCLAFVTIATLLEKYGLNVPHIYQQDLTQGFILLSDLGKQSYLERLRIDSVQQLYKDALSALLTMQTRMPHAELPPYSAELLRREMHLFQDWFLAKHLQIELDSNTVSVLMNIFSILQNNALEQPRVFVHRDYHSRNLMVTKENNPGILDFQDAVSGPITYDLVSLLRDCYIAWPEADVYTWLKQYFEKLLANDLTQTDYAQFEKWFDLMGMQRHLKAIGIFARLKHRDGKNGYIKDIPRTLNYVVYVCSRYTELQPFADLLQTLHVQERITECKP